MNYCDTPQKAYPFRERANLAPHLERNVCLCREPGKLIPKTEYGGICVCDNCRKMPVYWIYKCTYCQIEFLHDFEQNFCYKEPLCYTCNEFNTYCSGHTYCITYIADSKQVPPAVKLLQPFTEEDLEGVFDFD